MRVVSVVGARPQFVKLGTVWKALCAAGIPPSNHVIIHTGQHYDHRLSDVFFDELGLPSPHHKLGVGSGEHGEQTGRMLERVERALRLDPVDLVVVFGDTNSTLAAALAAVKQGIPVAHVEAGLRSGRKQMPEEVNRILTDHVSTILFCPTRAAMANLVHEGIGPPYAGGELLTQEDVKTLPLEEYGIDRPLVVNVGDVMYDSVLSKLAQAEGRADALRRLELEAKSYVLATVHRAANTDDPRRLRGILDGLRCVASADRPVVFPAHPRTEKQMETYGLPVGEDVRMVSPIGYLDFLYLEAHAACIVTDSGGVQKEAFFLGVPCITLRDETEWIETVSSGWNTLVPTEPDMIASATKEAILRGERERPPLLFGDGHAGERIASVFVAWERSL